MENRQNSDIPDAFLKDENFVKKIANKFPEILLRVPQLSSNKNFMHDILNQGNPKAFQYASDTLRNDLSFIIENIEYNPKLAEYVSPSIWDNSKALDMLIDKEPLCAAYIPNLSKEKIISAIQKDGEVLTAFPEMQKDEEMIRLAAETKPEVALMYVTEEMCKDREWVKEQLDRSANFLFGRVKYLSEKIRNDTEFMEYIMKNICSYAFQHASNDLKNNKDVILDFLQKGYYVDPNFVSPSLQRDNDFLLKAGQYDRDFFQYLQLDKPGIVKAAMERQNMHLIHQIPDKMWENKKIRSMLDLQYFDALSNKAKDLIINDKKLILAKLDNTHTTLIQYLAISPQVKTDPDYMNALIKNLNSPNLVGVK